MFGYIKPFVPELKIGEYEVYRAVYCGLCKCMGNGTSLLLKLTLSYDTVFLVLVRLAIKNETISFSKKRCLFHPTKKRLIANKSDELQFCARVSSALVYYKSLDNIHDKSGTKKLLSYLIHPIAAHLHSYTKEIRELDEKIKKLLDELSALEAAQNQSLDKIAEIFGMVLGECCAYGMAGEDYKIAYEIGFHTGKFIYISDAADDLEKDIKYDEYNPLRYANTDKSVMYGFVKDSLTLEAQTIYNACGLVMCDNKKISALISNITSLGLVARAQEIFDKKTSKL